MRVVRRAICTKRLPIFSLLFQVLVYTATSQDLPPLSPSPPDASPTATPIDTPTAPSLSPTAVDGGQALSPALDLSPPPGGALSPPPPTLFSLPIGSSSPGTPLSPAADSTSPTQVIAAPLAPPSPSPSEQLPPNPSLFVAAEPPPPNPSLFVVPEPPPPLAPPQPLPPPPLPEATPSPPNADPALPSGILTSVSETPTPAPNGMPSLSASPQLSSLPPIPPAYTPRIAVYAPPPLFLSPQFAASPAPALLPPFPSPSLALRPAPEPASGPFSAPPLPEIPAPTGEEAPLLAPQPSIFGPASFGPDLQPGPLPYGPGALPTYAPLQPSPPPLPPPMPPPMAPPTPPPPSPVYRLPIGTAVQATPPPPPPGTTKTPGVLLVGITLQLELGGEWVSQYTPALLQRVVADLARVPAANVEVQASQFAVRTTLLLNNVVVSENDTVALGDLLESAINATLVVPDGAILVSNLGPASSSSLRGLKQDIQGTGATCLVLGTGYNDSALNRNTLTVAIIDGSFSVTLQDMAANWTDFLSDELLATLEGVIVTAPVPPFLEVAANVTLFAVTPSEFNATGNSTIIDAIPQGLTQEALAGAISAEAGGATAIIQSATAALSLNYVPAPPPPPPSPPPGKRETVISGGERSALPPGSIAGIVVACILVVLGLVYLL